MCKAYYQAPLAEQCRRYTAFPTNQGLMQFTRLPFGLSTACASYMRLMRIVMKDLSNVSCYFDNVFVYTKSWKEHIHILQLVLDRLREHGLTIGPSKCFIGYSTIKYLGLELGNDSIRPLSQKIGAISDMPLPKNKKALRSFIGTLSFYRKFIPDLASRSAILTSMLRKGSCDPLRWNDKQIECFNGLKTTLISPPILKLPDISKPFCIRTDASNEGISGLLLQYHNDIPMPVAYASRKLLPRECNYATVEKECLALVWVEKFKIYLYGKRFIIESDHEPLKYMKSFKNSNSRLMRWAISLQPYKYTVVYIKGCENVGADLLSRCIP